VITVTELKRTHRATWAAGNYAAVAEMIDEAPPRDLLTRVGSRPGERVLDVATGTGNLALRAAAAGAEVVGVDLTPELFETARRRAAARGVAVEWVEGDAEQLPFEDESFDAATMISMLHHVDDQGVALAEARRILRPGGRLVLKGFTGEDAESLWILDYFPSSRAWIEETHPPRAAILEELPGARLLDFEFEDMEDASLAALSADPERVLEAGKSGATSYFERMQRDHPDELRAGLTRLQQDITTRRAPRCAGTATVLSWTKR
jgi:SAM-dependent methyltransferase